MSTNGALGQMEGAWWGQWRTRAGVDNLTCGHFSLVTSGQLDMSDSGSVCLTMFLKDGWKSSFNSDSNEGYMNRINFLTLMGSDNQEQLLGLACMTLLS